RHLESRALGQEGTLPRDRGVGRVCVEGTSPDRRGGVGAHCRRGRLHGWAAKGRFWPQILADVLDVPVHVPAVKESTALGAAVCAGVGAGVYSSLADVARLVRVERTFEPETAASAAYGTLYEQWRDVYDRVLQISEDGVVR